MNLPLPAFGYRLKRDVALRTGVIAACTSLIALLLLAFIARAFLIQRLEARVENSLTERQAVADSVISSFSEGELATLQKFRQTLPIRDEGVFSWLDSDGNQISGSVSGVDCRSDFYDGWLDISNPGRQASYLVNKPAGITATTYDRFRFLAGERGERCLVFGKSMYEVDAVHDSVKGLFVWLIPLCLIPSIAISLLHSLSLRRRLQNIGDVVQRVAAGELDARVAIKGEDNIDELGRSANKSFDKLQDSVNTLQQLTSVIAHDLRGPLSRISNPLDEAIRANESGKVDTESLYEVRDGLGDARSVFDALLRITQIESGRRRSKFRQVDLFAISEEMFEIYEAVVEESGRTLEFEVTAEGTSHINGDADLLRQALVNLIENAIRYTPTGAHIRITLLRHETSPELIVSDNGPGVPEKELKNVVKRLYRYEESTRGKNGHGLGLSLVKAIAELHNGSLRLEDAKPGLKVRLKVQQDL